MRTRWGWYMAWADDDTKTEWMGYCPSWVDSMIRHSKWSGRALKVRRVKFLTPKKNFCIECQVNH